jgi:NAD(P)-dependent dehydrogenase (short-subunit alcohol dehydrogenase family)
MRLGRRVETFPADMSVSTSVDSTVRAVLEAFGRVDILINGVRDAIPSCRVPAAPTTLSGSAMRTSGG